MIYAWHWYWTVREYVREHRADRQALATVARGVRDGLRDEPG